MCVLSRFHEAWDLCKSASSDADWAEFGKACLVHMEVGLAIQAYRISGNVAMVLSLQGVRVQNTLWLIYVTISPLNTMLLLTQLSSPFSSSHSLLVSVSPSVQGTEDMNLLAGHLAMFLEDFNLAQNLYLSSSCPVAALEVCLYLCIFV